MLDGRPANRCYYTSFNYDEATQNVDSLEKETDVSGWQNYSGQIDKDMREDGVGKKWYDDGDIYIGTWEKGTRTGRTEYVLQEDHTHTLYSLKYELGDENIERKEISRGHKLV